MFLRGKIDMPELPEVETIVNDLNEKVSSRTIRNVWSDIERFGVKKLKLGIVGSKIKRVERAGKNILFYLTGEKILLVHQKMTGHLMYGKWKIEKNSGGKEKVLSLSGGPFEDKANNYIHLIFGLDNGRQIALSDLRKFAKVKVYHARNAGEIEMLKNLGPDALKVNFADFRKGIAVEKGSIKRVLMNQEFISGIGNIYSDEILWKAEIYPGTKIGHLSAISLKKIFEEMKIVLKKAVKKRGTSISDFRDAFGEKGKYGNELLVYRRAGQPCFRCGDKITRIKINGRGACFCPVCQAAIKIHA